MSNIHPITVHFTLALFMVGAIAVILGILLKRETWQSFGDWNIRLAALAAVASVLSGLQAIKAPHNEAIHLLMVPHRTLGLIALGLMIMIVLAGIIKKSELATKYRALYLLLLFAVIAVIAWGGYLGGEMVYRHGMGVGPVMEEMSRQINNHEIPHEHSH